MREFKVGDKVYYPIKSTKVLTIGKNNSPVYPIFVTEHLTIDGKFYTEDALPSIFHATPENHKALEQLFGVEFEKPPVNPTSREIIKAMLARGDKYVLCRVINYSSDDWFLVLIERVCENGGYIDDAGIRWDSAKPINPRTGMKITELPEGAKQGA